MSARDGGASAPPAGRHAGQSRIADQALIDQVRACAEEMTAHLLTPLPTTVAEGEAHRAWRNRWIGRAHWLLEQVGELGQ